MCSRALWARQGKRYANLHIIIQDAMRRGTAAHPSRPALARRGIRSERLVGLRSRRDALGSLSWNTLENSGYNRSVLEYPGMLVDVLQSAPGSPRGSFEAWNFMLKTAIFES